MCVRTANASNFAPTSPTLVADLLGDVAVKVIEHEPDVRLTYQFRPAVWTVCFPARHAIRGCQLIVAIDHTD